jgi:hypothetical protein
MTRPRKTPPMCGKTGGDSPPDGDGDVHVHTCTRSKGHGGKHACGIGPCGYRW